MNKVTKTFALAALAAAGMTTAAMAQDAVVKTTTTAVMTQETADQTVTHAVVQEQTTQPAAMMATHTVQTIMASPKNDAKVTLVGTIGAKVAKNTYAFTDRTGMIEVMIPKDKMPANMAVGQMVRLDGEINWSTFKRHIRIDADKVSVI